MSSVPLQRCLAKARKEGYEVWIVERFIKHPPFGHRVDLFNLFDAVAIRADSSGVLGIQACRDADIAEHMDKVLKGDPTAEKESERLPNAFLPIWKAAGNRAVIWGWGERVRRDEEGKQARLKDGTLDRRKVWTCREIIL